MCKVTVLNMIGEQGTSTSTAFTEKPRTLQPQSLPHAQQRSQHTHAHMHITLTARQALYFRVFNFEVLAELPCTFFHGVFSHPTSACPCKVYQAHDPLLVCIKAEVTSQLCHLLGGIQMSAPAFARSQRGEISLSKKEGKSWGPSSPKGFERPRRWSRHSEGTPRA